MKLVNLTRRPVYNSMTGTINPGKSSSDRSGRNSPIESALESIIKMCGNDFGIVLNDRELELIDKVVDLDEKGSKFNPSSIPAEIRNDPTGEKRAVKAATAAQQRAIDAQVKKGVEGQRREAMINGEIVERKPVGPGRMEGEKVDANTLRSGFDAIIEENARIAAGKKKQPLDEKEALDPIGKFAKKEGSAAPKADENRELGPADASKVKLSDGEGDATKSANAKLPEFEAADTASKMDKLAAKTVNSLSIFSAFNDPKLKSKQPEQPEQPEQPQTPPPEEDNEVKGGNGRKGGKGVKGAKETKGRGKPNKSK